MSLLIPLGVYLLFCIVLAGLALGSEGYKNFNTALRVFSHIPLLFLFEILFLYLPLLFYFGYGLGKLTERETHLFSPLNTANTLYFFHGVTLFLSLAFLCYHFFVTRFSAYLSQISLDYLWMVRLFENPYAILVYLVGGFSVIYHFAYSLRNLLIDMGWSAARGRFFVTILVFLAFLTYLIFFLAVLNFVYHYNDPPIVLKLVIHFVRDVLSR